MAVPQALQSSAAIRRDVIQMHTFFRRNPRTCLGAGDVKGVYECGETGSLEAQREASLSTGPTHMLGKEPLITCLTVDA